MNINNLLELYKLNKNRSSFSNIFSLIISPITFSLFLQSLFHQDLLHMISFNLSLILSSFCFYINYKSNKNIKLILRKLEGELKREILMTNVREILDHPSNKYKILKSSKNYEMYYKIENGILSIYKNDREVLLRVV